MTVNASERLLPSRAYVFLAPVGTVAPIDSVVALSEDWINVGHTTPDSLGFNTEPEFGEINSHQSDYAIDRFQTSDSASVSVDLIQWNAHNMRAAFGGGTITEVGEEGSGNFKFSPPKMGVRQQLSCIVQLEDGDKHYRWVYVKTMQIEGVQNEFQKGQEARLPLRLAILGDDAGDPWYLLTDDPAFDPTA